MEQAKVNINLCHVAGPPIYVPDPNPDNIRCMVNVIQNGPKRTDGRPQKKNTFTTMFWRNLAKTAAYYCYKGRPLSIEGRLDTNLKPLGIIENGKEKFERTTQVNVDNLQFIGDSMKKIQENITNNLMVLKQQGRIPANCDVSAAELINFPRPIANDFDPNIAATTGMFGSAKVYTKDRGLWINHVAPIGAVASAVPSSTNAMEAELNALRAENAALKSEPETVPEIVTDTAEASMAAAGEAIGNVPDPLAA